MQKSSETETPVHEKYGTLDDLLGLIKKDIVDGYYYRIYQAEALNWFSDAYAKNGAEDDPRPAA